MKIDEGGYRENLIIRSSAGTINSDPLLQNKDSLLTNKDSSVLEVRDIIEISNKSKKCHKILNCVASLCIGVGMGFASMPIFTSEFLDLKDIGIDVHGSKSLFIFETINTGLVFSIVNTATCYYMLNKTRLLTKNPFNILKEYFSDANTKTEMAKKIFHLGASACSGTFTNSLLWSIELHNRNVTKSDGFDEYIGYALACTIPIFVAKALTTYDSITKDKHIFSAKIDYDLRKVLSILVSLIAVGGRYFAYTYTATEFCKALKLDDTTSIVIGNVVGGIIGNVASAVKNYYELNYIFRSNCKNMNKADFMAFFVSAVEGIWFSLPTITIANRAMNTHGFHDVLKGILLAPLIGVTTLGESKDVFESYLNMIETKNSNKL